MMNGTKATAAYVQLFPNRACGIAKIFTTSNDIVRDVDVAQLYRRDGEMIKLRVLRIDQT